MILPKKLWQWILIYPTLFISLGVNVPGMILEYKASKHNMTAKQFKEAENQQEIWKRNIDCIREVKNVMTATTKTNDTVSVGACEDTGDIIVEIDYADGRNDVKWVSFKSMSPATTAMNSTLMSVLSPKGAIANELLIPSMYQQRQRRIRTICQWWIDRNRLFRRVQVEGDGCYDVIINTFYQKVESRKPVRCEPCNQ